MTGMTKNNVILTRKRLGISQEKMSDLCQCSYRMYQYWEKNGVKGSNALLLRILSKSSEALEIALTEMQERLDAADSLESRPTGL